MLLLTPMYACMYLLAGQFSCSWVLLPTYPAVDLVINYSTLLPGEELWVFFSVGADPLLLIPGEGNGVLQRSIMVDPMGVHFQFLPNSKADNFQGGSDSSKSNSCTMSTEGGEHHWCSSVLAHHAFVEHQELPSAAGKRRARSLLDRHATCLEPSGHSCSYSTCCDAHGADSCCTCAPGMLSCSWRIQRDLQVCGPLAGPGGELPHADDCAVPHRGPRWAPGFMLRVLRLRQPALQGAGGLPQAACDLLLHLWLASLDRIMPQLHSCTLQVVWERMACQ
jgi:hypothetical protein